MARREESVLSDSYIILSSGLFRIKSRYIRYVSLSVKVRFPVAVIIYVIVIDQYVSDYEWHYLLHAEVCL